MATLDDLASDKEQQDRDQALEAWRRQAQNSGLVPIGECLSCGEPELPEGHLYFCCMECRDDYDRKQKVRRIAGKGVF